VRAEMGGSYAKVDTWRCLFRIFAELAADVAEVEVKWSVIVKVYALRPQHAGLLLNMRRLEHGQHSSPRRAQGYS
jgi:hypothetical protein